MTDRAAIATASAEPRQLPAPAPGAPDGSGVPEWVQLLPAPDARGMIHCRDGRSWLLDDLAGVVAAFAAHGAPLAPPWRPPGAGLAIDFGHSLDRPGRAGTVEAERAAGWLEQLDLRDGAPRGRIEWTPRARAMVAARPRDSARTPARCCPHASSAGSARRRASTRSPGLWSGSSAALRSHGPGCG